MNPIILIAVAAIVLFVTISALISRYKRCPSDKILVIYGRTGGTSARCVHGGGAFIWPVIQDYAFLDLKPLSIEANLTNALSRQNIRVDVPCRFTIAISTESDSMNTAAERLLGLSYEQVQELAKDILFGQLRLVIATMTIEEINSDRDKFLDNISKNVDSELKKIGLKLINVNVTDIRDESGYIEALGKEAAAKAINEAKISVAEQEKIGEIGKALADREKDTQIAETHRDRDVKIAITQKDKEISIATASRDETIGKAEAQRDTRVKTSEANAIAIQGENEAKIAIANSEALRREKEAESLRVAIAAEKVQQAKALEESYVAEQKAELARSERERSTQIANIVVPAEIAKQRAIIEAQAAAETIRENARGEADAIYAKMEAEAKGLFEILTKQAEGYKDVVAAAGGDPSKAFQLLLLEKLPELVKTQVEAVKNIKIDKITVWDSGNGQGENGGSTANFVSGMMKTVPPLNDLFNMAGLNLPSYLKGEDTPEVPPAIEVVEKEE
ncbi:flotillin family protein [Flavobacterium johnsoniae]|uniref:Band 7 protein n=1 Tax=Flavobacterium johnsoniae (strain ATCC 17061 / DSM 2064 / JCM 8514 / BCRC 14874 / CCUG 350202 / NBRC 14942 / NCIMB 11054 / UW101) TaxID=376686 RepID=A5FLN0_FLAJ1|nr:flotillin family protein [Flavobacterium johnsoniae]ABQ03894.1 band 7 protein [Flavobacterium johnsoniae UW101]OXE96236.1 flotillin [Flavobacterium johnsoniae UW101]WQG79241.1 SPFH domain-containing protein [Flavobacterium johnsoniae UW101]SHK05853.1 flotillin [Flavobacterium johnsoniae]